MKISRAFFLTMLFFIVIFGITVNRSSLGAVGRSRQSPSEQIQKLDEEIEELEEMKRGYESKALWHENQADRLQHKSSEYFIAKKHWELAVQNRRIADRIQDDIDDLKEKRQKLIHANQ